MTSERLLNSFIPPKPFIPPKKFWLRPWSSGAYIAIFLSSSAYNTQNYRNMGLSPTWGRQAPQVRLEGQFRTIPLVATPPSECPRKPHPRTTWRMELRQVTLNAHLRRVNMRPYNFFCLWTKVHHIFCPTWKGLLLINCFFSDFDTSIAMPSGDIRDQSWKLPEIAPNFNGLYKIVHGLSIAAKMYDLEWHLTRFKVINWFFKCRKNDEIQLSIVEWLEVSIRPTYSCARALTYLHRKR